MISKTPLDDLMQLGRQRGALEIDDIRQVLEVDTMPPEELADVVVWLDEAGILVEIDPVLLAFRPLRMTRARRNPHLSCCDAASRPRRVIIRHRS